MTAPARNGFAAPLPAGEPEQEQRRELLSRVADHIGEGVAVFDLDDWLLYANPALATLHECQVRDLVGQHLSTFIGPPPDGHEGRAAAEAAGNGVLSAEISSRRLDGSPLDVDVTVSSLLDDLGARIGRIVCVHDVTARKSLERRLERASLHDPLTDLPNRRLLADRLEQALTRAERNGTGVAVLFLDLDGFKGVNDKHGHAVGDQLLIETAARLRAGLREADTLARLGGDEFVVVLEQGSEPLDPMATAQRLVSQLAPPFLLAGLSISISASIGIAVSASGAQRSLLHAADTAMYQAKIAGRGKVVISRWDTSTEQDELESARRSG